MKKDEALSKEFLSQFKTGEDLFAFMKELQKRGVEQFLEAEMDEHLGYEKSQISDNKTLGMDIQPRKSKPHLVKMK
jgi:transposase-like protein